MKGSLAGRLLTAALAVACTAPLAAAPARAVSPDGATAREPYAYPAGPEEPAAYPQGWVRGPAVAADLLLVRPAMLVGLAGGAVLFVATLPFTAATMHVDDAADALLDQTASALVRPLGEF